MATGKATDYTLEEKVVGKWVDDRPVYQKTYSFGALSNSAEKKVAHGVENFDFPIQAFGFTYTDDYSGILPIPYLNATTIGSQINIVVDRTNISIATGSNRTTYKNTYVTIQYVKTSDLPE